MVSVQGYAHAHAPNPASHGGVPALDCLRCTLLRIYGAAWAGRAGGDVRRESANSSNRCLSCIPGARGAGRASSRGGRQGGAVPTKSQHACRAMQGRKHSSGVRARGLGDPLPSIIHALGLRGQAARPACEYESAPRRLAGRGCAQNACALGGAEQNHLLVPVTIYISGTLPGLLPGTNARPHTHTTPPGLLRPSLSPSAPLSSPRSKRTHASRNRNRRPAREIATCSTGRHIAPALRHVVRTTVSRHRARAARAPPAVRG